MTAQEAIAYIHSYFWKGAEPGLERIRELLRRMGDPQKLLKFVHVAGTNGKGSTVAMTASLLEAANYRTGMFTSPYLYRFHERMQVNGVPITDEELVEIVEFIRPLAEAMEVHPTEFELVTAIGMEFFRRKACEIVVLEVGMGGALDSTNVIDCPELAVITNIGLDHTEYLGDSVEKIAETKAGIFKEGGRAVVYRGTPGVEAVFSRICKERHLSLRKADFESLRPLSHSLEGQTFDCGGRKNLFLPLLGEHQLRNAAVVLEIADSLRERGWKISEEAVREGLRRVSWPGRFEILRRKPLFIIDGGHNPQCLEALKANIRDYLADNKILAITGVLADKDYGEMYRPLLPYISEFLCITPSSPRRLEAEALASHLRESGAKARAFLSAEEAVKEACALADENTAILAFGSLYMLGDIKAAADQILPEEAE